MKSTVMAAVLALALPAAVLAETAAAPFIAEQQSSEWRVNNYVGQHVYNATGQKVGDVNDILFDKTGKVTAVVLSVGGFLGMGVKYVALPYQAITYEDKDGVRQIVVPLTKDVLLKAPDFRETEKTTLDKVRDKAGAAAEKAGEKASELKDRAKKKIEEYSK